MDHAHRPRQEVVFETTPAPDPDVGDHADAAQALERLPGVLEAHVDHHGTWAMVTFDPEIATISSLTGGLAAHGLTAQRMRSLSEAGDESRPRPDPAG